MKTTNNVISYLTQKGYLPEFYENLEEVTKEFNTTNFTILVAEPGTPPPKYGEVTDQTNVKYYFVADKYYYSHSPHLIIFSRIMIALILVGGVYGMITQGFQYKTLVSCAIGSILFFLAPDYVKTSIFVLFFVGCMPFITPIYLLFSGTDISEFWNYFASQKIGFFSYLASLTLLVMSIIIFLKRYDVCIVLVDNERKVHVKCDKAMKKEFGLH